MDHQSTAPLVGALYLKRKRFQKSFFTMEKALTEDFKEFKKNETQPEAIVIGDLDKRFSYKPLNEAFRFLMNGAALVAFSEESVLEQEGHVRASQEVNMDVVLHKEGRYARTSLRNIPLILFPLQQLTNSGKFFQHTSQDFGIVFFYHLFFDFLTP